MKQKAITVMIILILCVITLIVNQLIQNNKVAILNYLQENTLVKGIMKIQEELLYVNYANKVIKNDTDTKIENGYKIVLTEEQKENYKKMIEGLEEETKNNIEKNKYNEKEIEITNILTEESKQSFQNIINLSEILENKTNRYKKEIIEDTIVVTFLKIKISNKNMITIYKSSKKTDELNQVAVILEYENKYYLENNIESAIQIENLNEYNKNIENLLKGYEGFLKEKINEINKKNKESLKALSKM